MLRIELLKSKMVANKINAEKLSNILGIDTATFYRKTNGKSEFNRVEIQLIKNVLHLTVEDMDTIFFADELTETQETL